MPCKLRYFNWHGRFCRLIERNQAQKIRLNLEVPIDLWNYSIHLIENPRVGF